MITARSQVLRGPAIVQYNSQTFYSQADIRVEMVQEMFPIQVSHIGKADERVDKIMHRVRFVPDGRWTALSTLFPYATATIGSSVFGTDKTLTIWTKDGYKRVYKAAAVTKMPNIMMSAVKTLLGEVEFTCIHAEASAWTDANSLYTDSLASYPGDSGYLVTDIITQTYTSAWIAAKTFTAVAATDVCTATGHRFHNFMRLRASSTTTLPAGLTAATDLFAFAVDRTLGTLKVASSLANAEAGIPVDITDVGTGTHTFTPNVWSSFGSKEGTAVEFNLSIEPEFNDDKGVFDYTFQNLEVMANIQAEATGMKPADILAALIQQGSGAVRGRSLNEAGSDLIMTGTGVYVLLNQAALVQAAEAYGPSSRRIQPAQWRATRTFTAGEPDALFYVGTSAPA
jgi:hypothetical protein